ncbi:MAG: YkgJ family cysteine cluster protein [Myxococcales bacterium]|nr:YkgJ family cysteine cluster protein [Myxococcales bacterium]
MAHSFVIPALRRDLELSDNRGAGPEQNPVMLRDADFEQTLYIDQVGARLVQELHQSRALDELLAVVGDSPGAPLTLYNYLVYFHRYHLYDDARSARYQTIAKTQSERPSAPRRLLFHEQARHLCQASGSCCGHTDIGPIPEARRKRILAVDWTPEMPWIASNDELFKTYTLADGRDVTVIQRDPETNYCRFLQPDRLCAVHRHRGYEAKPLICRQFPFVFSETPEGIAVSIQMECREYLAAKHASAPLESDREAELWQLIDQGATKHSVPQVIDIDGHASLAYADYLELEGELLATLQLPTPLGERLIAIRDRVEAARRRVVEAIGERPAYLEARSWRDKIPNLLDYSNDPKSVLAAAQRTYGELSQTTQRDYATYQEINDSFSANRVINFQKALSGLFFDFRFAAYPNRDGSVDEVLRDGLLNFLFGKEAARHETLVQGLARGMLRLLLTWSHAILLATYGCRSHLDGRDGIDAMVTVNKIFRDKNVRESFDRLHRSLAFLFFDRLELFVGGADWQTKVGRA